MENLIMLVLVMAMSTGPDKGLSKTHQLTRPGFTMEECQVLAKGASTSPILNTEDFFILDAYCIEVKK